MRLPTTKQLNRAEKIVLCAVFAALLTTSSKPQVVHASVVTVPTFEAQTPAPAEDPAPTPSPITVKKTMTVTATAYSSSPDQTDDTPFITSNGKRVYDGLIAANWLPYNTKIRIPDMFGDKIFTVNDRMNARYASGRFDVWMPSREAAKQFGLRHVRVEIVETQEE